MWGGRQWRFARLIGTSASLLANYLLGASAVAIVLLTDDLSWISLSAFILGFFLLVAVGLGTSFQWRHVFCFAFFYFRSFD